MENEQDHAFREEQLAAMQADALYSLSINAFMSMTAALVIAYTYWPQSQASGLLPWLVFDFAHALGWLGLAQFRKRPDACGLSDTAWRSIYVGVMFVGGVVWGLGGMLFIPAGSPDQALVASLVAMGAVLATYPVVIYKLAFLAFQVPVFWLSAIGFLASDTTYGSIIAGMAILISLALIHIGKQMGDKLAGAMMMAIENAEMVRTQETQAKALAHANEELERLSYLDPLTGLGNRRRLMIEMRTQGRSPEAGLLIVDVDHFKQYNDTYGHGAGDVCLIEIARILKHHSEVNDGFAARQGGEEFCLLFAPADSRRIMEIAETIRSDVEKLFSGGHPLERTVTVSIGCALRKPEMYDDAFMRVADEAVYAAKREGRNRTVNADTPGTNAPQPMLEAS